MDTLHDRAGNAAAFILGAVGLTEERVQQFMKIAHMLKKSPPVPPVGPLAQLAQIQELAKKIPDFEITSMNPDDYLKHVPEEKIAYLLQIAIDRMEWVLHGDTKAITESSSGAETETISAETSTES